MVEKIKFTKCKYKQWQILCVIAFVLHLIPVIATAAEFSSHVTEGSVIQRIDPSNSEDTRTFSQRYFFDDEYADGPGSPVFFYLSGEDDYAKDRISGLMTEAAKKYHGYQVVLEHRYFGRSLPFNDLSTEHLRYLTAENAIKDAVSFVKFLKSSKHLTGRWIAMGASYSGALAARLRQKYPNLIAGALASSAVVQSQISFYAYDENVAETLGPQCSQTVRRAVEEIRSELKIPELATSLKSKFAASELKRDDDFLSWVADVVSTGTQYGFGRQLCDYIRTKNPLAGLARFTQVLVKYYKISPTMEVPGAIGAHPHDPDSRAFLYLTCKELGNWVDASPNRQLIVFPPELNQKYRHESCQRLFGSSELADPESWNKKFYLPLLDPKTTNILFTNGSEDPWSTASITAENGKNINPNIWTYTIERASHAQDIAQSKRSDSESLKTARELFMRLVALWLNGG